MSGVTTGGISSTILYKFRSSTNYESLPMPGTLARLFDVKRAIVKAKKLDKAAGGGLEFDLRITNASTDEVYLDDNILLPRGTRVIVQRLPAARGFGLLAKIAREEAGVQSRTPHIGSVDSNASYTISSVENEEDGFVRHTANVVANLPQPTDRTHKDEDEEDELKALKAVTDPSQAAAKTGTILGYNNRFGAVNSVSAPSTLGQHSTNWVKSASQIHGVRPSARGTTTESDSDPKQTAKKRATGIPRTFLNFVDKSSKVEGEGGIDGSGETSEGEPQSESTIRLQPNHLGFQQLLQRAGGKSSGANPLIVLQNALTITATDIPDYLKCGICGNVVQNAMLLPWDREGRTACETCIRPALARNNFICPLTGTENVSPDELIPNFGLRKAAENFVAGVLEKLDQIEKEAQKLAEGVAVTDNLSTHNENLFQKETKHGSLEEKKKRRYTSQIKSDELGGEHHLDDFGGDVFDVDPKVEDYHDNKEIELRHEIDHSAAEEDNNDLTLAVDSKVRDEAANTVQATSNVSTPGVENALDSLPLVSSESERKLSFPQAEPTVESTGQDNYQTHRGPPAGYAIGPAAPTALNNPRMTQVPHPIISSATLPIPPPPPGIPPSNVNHHPVRGRGFQPYHQRGNHRGRHGRHGGYVRGSSVFSRFGGRGALAYTGGRSDSSPNLDSGEYPTKEIVPLQQDDISVASNVKRDISQISKEHEVSQNSEVFNDSSKAKALKNEREEAVDISQAQGESSEVHKRPSQTNSRDGLESTLPQAVAHFPHQSRGGRAVRAPFRPPEPFLRGQGNRGRWSYGHIGHAQVLPSVQYQTLPPYSLHHDAYIQRGRGRDFRGGGRPFYRGGRF